MRTPLHHRIPCAIALLGALTMMGCGVQVYTLGGPGHGTQFQIPQAAVTNPDPVVRSWVAYSLARSTCQMTKGGATPSRHDSFECELRPREVLVKRWTERSEVDHQDEYLDLLVEVEQAGFLAEYVWVYLRGRGWPRPDWLRIEEFDRWRGAHLSWHRPRTRIIGYWWSPS